MQPYFFPYIGYFQLLNAVDEFVIYDKVQFSKKGWIHRNRILVNGRDQYITLPLERASDFCDIIDRNISIDFERDRSKLLRRIEGAYHGAPQFNEVICLLRECLAYKDRNLFAFLYNSLSSVNTYLGINTPIFVSSLIESEHGNKGQDRVLEICKMRGASVYINAIGGTNLYDKAEFGKHGIELRFIKSDAIEYRQFGNPFVPNLSIIDVLMFNPSSRVREFLNSYKLIERESGSCTR